MLTKDFDSVNKTELFYFNHNPELIFLFSEQNPNTFLSKLYNYIYPHAYFVVYAGNTARDNMLFYFKLLFVYTWFTLGLILLFFVVIKNRKHTLHKK
jgi:hypothetical protein